MNCATTSQCFVNDRRLFRSHIDTLDEEETQQWKRAIFYLYLLILHRRPTEEHDELKTLVHQQIQETARREEGEAMAQTMAQYLIEQGVVSGV